MDPTLRQKVAQFLTNEGVFEKSAARMPPVGDVLRGAGFKLKALARAHRGKLGLIGGAGAVGGLATSMGKGEQKAQQDAAELNQLIEAYPELLYETPHTPYQSEGEPAYYQTGMGGYPQY